MKRTSAKHRMAAPPGLSLALGVIVPVLNEAATVRQLLQRVLLQKVVAEVIVVDDGSTDGTADILAQVKLSDCRVRVLHHSERRGKGAAIRTALLQVKSAVVVIQDADLEYDPADYESLLEPIRLEKAEIVYGSRFAGAGPAAGPRWHTWANRFLSWCARRITGLRISDEATCYKMCLRRVLVEMRLAENGFGFCPEFTAKAACLRARIVEVPIHYAPRTRAEGKKIRLWHGLEALVCLLRYRLFYRPAPARPRLSPVPGLRPRRAAGFTLLELLVVIAIVTTLAALLLPALGRGKAQARRIQCVNHHRNLVAAWLQFAHEHDDALPPTVDDGDNILAFTNWVSGNLARAEDSRNTAMLVDPQVSLLAAYLDASDVYKCPEDPSPLARSVSLNNRLNPVRLIGEPLCLGGWGTNYQVYRRLGQIGNPSTIFVTIDERFDSLNEGNFAVDMSNTGNFSGEGTPSPYWWIDTPAAYHQRGAVLSFADGHVEWHEWTEPTTLGPIGVTGPRHTSAGDRDASWLQTRCSEPIR